MYVHCNTVIIDVLVLQWIKLCIIIKIILRTIRKLIQCIYFKEHILASSSILFKRYPPSYKKNNRKFCNFPPDSGGVSRFQVH